MIQQVISNDFGVLAYGSSAQVAAGTKIPVVGFDVSVKGVIAGLSVGFGLSDVTAWDLGGFMIYINGQVVMIVGDQISDLLRPEFLPLPIKNGDKIKIEFDNASALIVDVSLVARVEVLR